MIAPEERRHLTDGPRPGGEPGGAGTVKVVARGGPGARTLLARCREVLLTVLGQSETDWPSTVSWAELLPDWFVAACTPERSPAEAERWLAWWRTLDPEEKAKAANEQPWTLADWLYWLTPAERQWYWWDATIESDTALRVVVEVPGWPAALGALDWLLRAAGATEVSHEENAASHGS